MRTPKAFTNLQPGQKFITTLKGVAERFFQTLVKFANSFRVHFGLIHSFSQGVALRWNLLTPSALRAEHSSTILVPLKVGGRPGGSIICVASSSLVLWPAERRPWANLSQASSSAASWILTHSSARVEVVRRQRSFKQTAKRHFARSKLSRSAMCCKFATLELLLLAVEPGQFRRTARS